MSRTAHLLRKRAIVPLPQTGLHRLLEVLGSSRWGEADTERMRRMSCVRGRAAAQGGSMSPRMYEFRVDGRVPEPALDAFGDLDVEEVPPGLILRGEVIDESHLHAIMALFRTHGLRLVWAEPLDPRDPVAGHVVPPKPAS
ncbi:hypothetical protein ACFPM0_12950 [Pseudonocardia sulfidoxydans]